MGWHDPLLPTSNAPGLPIGGVSNEVKCAHVAGSCTGKAFFFPPCVVVDEQHLDDVSLQGHDMCRQPAYAHLHVLNPSTNTIRVRRQHHDAPGCYPAAHTWGNAIDSLPATSSAPLLGFRFRPTWRCRSERKGLHAAPSSPGGARHGHTRTCTHHWHALHQLIAVGW